MTRASTTWPGDRKKPGARQYNVISMGMPSTEPLDEPKIRTGTQFGPAVRRCAPQQAGQVMRYGYGTMMSWEPRYLTMVDDGVLLATTSLADRQSRAIAARSTSGTVVVVGLGLGTFLHSVMARPKVERVFAFDVDRRIIDMVSYNMDRYGWEGRDKVTLHWSKGCDVTRGLLDCLRYDGVVDYLYADLRPSLTLASMVDQVRLVVEGLFPFTTGFQGQELAMVDWMRNYRSPPLWDMSRMSLEHFDEWCIHVGVTLGHRSMEYLDYAKVCWAVQKSRVDHDAFRSVMKTRPPGPRWYTKSMYVDPQGQTTTDEVWLYAANEFVARRLACRVLEDDFGMAKLLDMQVGLM